MQVIRSGVEATTAKQSVQDFWDEAACGEVYAEGNTDRERFERQREARYELEPFIEAFAKFEDAKGLDVLEIGVGMGADHLEFANHGPARLIGVDLTPRAVLTTRRRAEEFGASTELFVGDAEALAFPDSSFDRVYSWGVLHHSPDTPAALREVRRVLRPNGVARLMVYQRRSIVGAMLWLRYGLAQRRPTTSFSEIYSMHLESPGTKAYTREEAIQMMHDAGFTTVRTSVELSGGDLLIGAAGQRHEGAILRVARRVWPRPLIRRFGRRLGLFLMVEAR